MTTMANADLSPTMEALEQEPSSGKGKWKMCSVITKEFSTIILAVLRILIGPPLRSFLFQHRLQEARRP